MALTPCRECGQQVSTEAASCPSCGAPDPTTDPARRTMGRKGAVACPECGTPWWPEWVACAGCGATERPSGGASNTTGFGTVAAMGRELAHEASSIRQGDPGPVLRRVALGLAGAFAGLLLLASLLPEADDDPIGAKVYCDAFVEERLKAPSTAEFADYDPAGVTGPDADGWYTVTGKVDAENAFGARLRTSYTCVLKEDGDRWIAKRVSVY